MSGTPAQPFLRDEHNDRTYPLTDRRWRSDDGNPLAIDPGPGITPDDIDRSTRSIWRYHASLPARINAPVSLGEGCTPLVRAPDKSANLHYKLEWFAPTGSFKDRGASVMISWLRQLDIDHILEDSSGNGGSAIAAFGAAADMRVRILAPAYTQPAKVAQIKAYGADVELVPGTRQDCEDEAIRQAEQVFYASHNWHPFFLQGTKSLGYEIWEDMGFAVPDNIIIPTGAGSNVLGCDLAFRELLAAGQIKKLPRLFCAQPLNCSPIHACFEGDLDTVPSMEFDTTVAEGTAIRAPVRLKTVLDCLRRSGGGTAALEESVIVDTTRRLAGDGLYVEPTCASAAAAYDQLVARGVISPDQSTVAVLTGTGLKASAFMAELFAD